MNTAIARRLESMEQKAGIKARDLAQLLNSTPETVSRWRTGRTEPRPSSVQNLLALEWLLDELADLYAPQEARFWLFARNRLLSGDSPAQRIQDGKIDDVLMLLDQMKSGAYV